MILVIKFDQLGIVCVSQASLRCYINNTEDGSPESVHVDIVALHIPILQIVKVIDGNWRFFPKEQASGHIMKPEHASSEKGRHDVDAFDEVQFVQWGLWGAVRVRLLDAVNFCVKRCLCHRCGILVPRASANDCCGRATTTVVSITCISKCTVNSKQ